MRMTRLYARDDGESAFDEAEIALPNEVMANGFLARTSEKYPAEQVRLIWLPEGYHQECHNAPGRQLVSVIDGKLEIVTSQGERKTWERGEVFFAEDVTGAGHRSAALDGAATLLIVHIPEDFDQRQWAVAGAEA